MTQQAPPPPLPAILMRARDGLILHQTLYAVARLGVADLLGKNGALPRNLPRN